MVTDSHNVKYEILIYPATRQFNREKKKKFKKKYYPDAVSGPVVKK